MSEVMENTATAMDEAFVISLEDLEGMPLGGMSSMSYCGSTLEEEERPGSSLSTASRSSRIPVLTRSHSLRVKSSSSSSSASHGQEGAKGSSKAAGKVRSEPRSSSRASPSVGKGLVRSASFVSSRGMKGLSSPPSPSTAHPAHRHLSHTLTPDTLRRATAHSSTHAKRSPSGAPDRKSHSYAGVMGSSWNHHPHNHHHNHHYNTSSSNNNHHYYNYHHQYHHLSYSHYSKRPNFLPVSTATSSSSQFSSLPTTPASQPDTPSRSPDSNDDADSVKSFGSVSSAVSCDAALTHHNRHQGQGTPCTGGSSRGVRSLKYVLHCRHNHEHDPDQYLTPTQRAARRIRELKAQLSEARREVQQRDTEIARLTRELVELRLLKARGPQWEEEEEEEGGAGGGRDATDGRGEKAAGKGKGVSATPATSAHTLATPKTTSGTPSEGSEPELRRLMENANTASVPDPAPPQHPPSASPAGGSVAETTADSVDLTRSSLADSGHYDDLTSPSLSSRDPFEANRGSVRGLRTEEESTEVEPEDEHEDETDATNDVIPRCGSRVEVVDPWVAVEMAEERLREEYLRREEMLKRNHLEEYHELKEKHNDKVEALLSKLSDANLKYFELRPLYDQSQERLRELDREVMRLKEELAEAELRHQKMYLQMFLKGQQAARIQAEDDLDGGEEGLLSSAGPMVELMRQLTRTEEELEKVKALYHREVNCRNNNTTTTTTNSRRNGELDPEVTLQFLKSAIYYFFTDRDNAKGHLRAIESILGYSDSERYNIGKVIK